MIMKRRLLIAMSALWMWAAPACATVICSLPVNLQNGTTADATQVMADFNSLAACFLNAAASGNNADITALSALTTPITPVQGGTTTYYGAVPSTGSANAQVVATVTPTGFSLAFPKTVEFIAGFSNTGATQLNVAAGGLVNVFKYSAAGPVALVGGEIVAGNLIRVSFDGTQWIIQNPVANLSPTLPGAIGLIIANDVSTPNTIVDVNADQAVMLNPTGNVPLFASTVAVAINCTTVGANGLDVGSLAINTWYNVFLISNGGTTAGLASLSATAPTMPSGYTYLVRLGAMRTDSRGNFLRTKQKGSRAQYVVTAGSNTVLLPNLINGISGTFSTSAPVYTPVSVSNFVPPTATRIMIVSQNAYGAATPASMVVAVNNSYLGPQSATGVYPAIYLPSGVTGAQAMIDLELESTNLYYASNAAGGTINAVGWTDKVNAN
jgi:hypothetical protein